MEKSEIENQEKEKQEYSLVGRITKPHKGMKLFEYSLDDESIEESKIVPEIYIDSVKLQPSRKNRLQVKKGFVYMWAINKKNAMKKINKEYGQLIQMKKDEKSRDQNNA